MTHNTPRDEKNATLEKSSAGAGRSAYTNASIISIAKRLRGWNRKRLQYVRVREMLERWG
ncbi:hypothetical protein BD626DRAFT_491744 [Schizophyllum amplum]|uniref:Uncharacterized protein n=1 Tax=Schizophyllum amplum TaxID=97359 RepID=A0A550CHZ1_9AGAR|nr:hypothetical protein BD626DRAFT_491744 [Auriculariopsis ampla]